MSDFGLKIGVEGEKEFKKALADINQSFKVLGSEMNLVTSQFDKQEESTGLTRLSRSGNGRMRESMMFGILSGITYLRYIEISCDFVQTIHEDGCKMVMGNSPFGERIRLFKYLEITTSQRKDPHA